MTGFTFEECTERIKREKTRFVFFTSLQYKLDLSALESHVKYKLRDEHEKNFDILKNQMLFRTQRNSSEDGKNGRAFISFVGLIIISSLHKIWKENLQDTYLSTYDVLDEMATIRFCEYANGKTHLTSFSAKQVEICSACDIKQLHNYSN